MVLVATVSLPFTSTCLWTVIKPNSRVSFCFSHIMPLPCSIFVLILSTWNGYFQRSFVKLPFVKDAITVVGGKLLLPGHYTACSSAFLSPVWHRPQATYWLPPLCHSLQASTGLLFLCMSTSAGSSMDNQPSRGWLGNKNLHNEILYNVFQARGSQSAIAIVAACSSTEGMPVLGWRAATMQHITQPWGEG